MKSGVGYAVNSNIWNAAASGNLTELKWRVGK